MAGNSEFIEVLSPSAIQDVKTLLTLLDTGVKKVNDINAAAKVIKLPSEARHSIQDLSKEADNNNKIMVAQQRLVKQVADARSKEAVEVSKLKVELTNLNRENKTAALQAMGLVSAYQKLTSQHAESSRRLQDLIVRGRQATQTQKDYDRELRTAQKEFQTLNQKVLSADKAVGRFNRNVGNYPQRAASGIRDLIGAFGVVGGVTAFAAITKDIFNTTRELQSLDLALKQVMGSQEGFTESKEFLSRISEAYGIELMGLTRSYTSFYAASQNAIAEGKITAEQIREIFESVSKASGAMGLSVEQQEGAFLALQQMISKGNVQAEEIRGQLAERLPGAFGILAKSMGVTEVELNKLLKDGKVLATEVLPAFAKELEKAYGVENLERVESLAASTSRLSNAWTEFIRELNSGEGVVSKFFITMVDGAAGALKLLGDLGKTRDELMKDVGDDAFSKGEANAMSFIKKSAEESGEEMAVWAETIKNKVIPQIAQLEQKLGEAQQIFEGSDESWLVRFFDKQTRDNWIQSQKDIENFTERLNFAKGELAAANKLMNQTPTPKFSGGGDDKGKGKRQKADIDYLKDVYELRKQNAENEIELQEELMNDEKKNYSVRLEAAENYFFQKEQLLKLEMEEQLRLNDLNFKNQKEQYQKAISEGKATYTNLKELEYQHTIRKIKINEDYENKKNRNAINSAKKLQGVLDAIEDQRQVNIVDEKQLANIRQLNNELNNVTTGTSYSKFKELEERKTKIVEDATEERLRIELRRTQAQIEALTADERQSQVYQDLKNKELKLTTDLENAEQARLEKTKELTLELKRATDEYLRSFSDNALSEAGLSSLNMFLQLEENGKTAFENLIDGADGLREKFQVAFAGITEVVQESFAFMTQNAQARFDIMYANLERERDIAIQFAGESEAGQAEVQRQYEEKRREIRIREAKAQKEQALFNAIINTAQAVVAALPNIPLSVIVGALGAAQIAMIASRPIPAYAEGIFGDESHPGGAMLVNDGRHREVVVTPDGKVSRPSGKNVLMNAPKGTQVFPSEKVFQKELDNILQQNSIAPFAATLLRDTYGMMSVNSGGGLTKEDATEAFKTALNSLSIVNNTFDENGYSSSIKKGNARTNNLNAVKTSKGITLR